MTETIKAFPSQNILGFVETDSAGNKTVKNFSGRIVAYYDADKDLTKDASLTPVAFGDVASGFLLR